MPVRAHTSRAHDAASPEPAASAPPSARARAKARQVEPPHPSPSHAAQQMILLAAATIPGQSNRISTLHWSVSGQILVTSKQHLTILTPCLGVHPQLLDQAFRLSSVECHPDYWDKFPHMYHQIDCRTFWEADPTIRTRSGIVKDYSAVHPTLLEQSWREADWVPAGLAAGGSSLFLALNNELQLLLIGARRNPFRAEDWHLVSSVNTRPLLRLVREENQVATSSGSNQGVSSSLLTSEQAAMRRESRVDQIYSFAWTEALPQASGPYASDDAEPCTSALLVAGTRSGHLGVWSSSSKDPVPHFTAGICVSSWDVLKVAIGPWHAKDGQDASLACHVAVQDRTSISLWTLKLASTGQVEIVKSHSQPPTFAGRMIAAWKWFGTRLAYASTGEVRIFDVDSAGLGLYRLDDGGREGCDPLLPAVDVALSLDSHVHCIVTLQDSSRYRVPLLADGDETPVHPMPAIETRGYIPALAEVQKQYDALQRLCGVDVELGAATPDVAMEATVRTYDPVASMGLDTPGSSRYNLWLPQDARLPSDPRECARQLLSLAVEGRQVRGGPTLTAVRHICAHFHTALDKTAFADGLRGVIKASVERVERQLFDDGTSNAEPDAHWPETQRALRTGQICFYIAQWLQREEDEQSAALLEDTKRLRLLLFIRHLGDGLALLLSEAEPAANLSAEAIRSDTLTCTRLAAAAYALLATQHLAETDGRIRRWLTKALERASDVFSKLRVDFDVIKGGWYASIAGNGMIETGEACGACQQRVTLRIDAGKGTVEWAQCASGHVWPRCDVTLAPLDTASVRVCSGCWSKAALPTAAPTGSEPAAQQQAVGKDEDIDVDADDEDAVEPLSHVLLRRTGRCLACGCDWVTM